MGYVIGISSGGFSFAGEREKETYLTVPRKIFYGGTKGVSFTQLDLESITEFVEPHLEEGVKKIRELGIRFGVHGESYAVGGRVKPLCLLDSAIQPNYAHAHQRLIEHIKGCGKIGAEYLIIHISENTPWVSMVTEFSPTKLVDPWGRPLSEFLKENPNVKKWLMGADFVWEYLRENPTLIRERYLFQLRESYIRTHQKEPEGKDLEKLVKEADRMVEKFFDNKISMWDLAYGSETVAYYAVAKWMMETGHELWNDIVGKKLSDEELVSTAPDPNKSWVPAVAGLYFLGHLEPKGMESPKKLLEKYKLYLLMEPPMAGPGLEGHMRISNPLHMIYVAKAAKSKWVGVVLDPEHILGNNLDPMEVVDSIPDGCGRLVRVVHLGYPTPHQPAHMGIPLGSKAQEYLYRFLFKLRQKGFRDGYLIFERAAESEIKQSITSIRKIVEYLEKDVPPEKLPPEFYGISFGNEEYARQLTIVRERAFDPLKGMLHVPEEEHTFLGSAALEKHKLEEWRKEKYR